jgi:hypothetical protein
MNQENCGVSSVRSLVSSIQYVNKRHILEAETPPRSGESTALESEHMNRFGTKRLLSFAAGWIATGLLAPSMRAATTDDQAVLVPINAMFDGMAKRDAAAIEAPALPGAVLVLMRYGKLEQITWEAFAERVAEGKTRIQERIHNPIVRIDRDLAVVWAPLEFLVDGKLDHCGTDSFSLVRLEGKWLIASLAATVRKDCGTAPIPAP